MQGRSYWKCWSLWTVELNECQVSSVSTIVHAFICFLPEHLDYLNNLSPIYIRANFIENSITAPTQSPIRRTRYVASAWMDVFVLLFLVLGSLHNPLACWIAHWASVLRPVDELDSLVQDCGNSSAWALELLQSCTKPSKWSLETGGLYNRVFFGRLNLSIISILNY